MSLRDFKNHLDAKTVYLIYHGGCPDGCFAVLILRAFIIKYCKPRSLELIPTAHAKRNADKVTDDGSTAFVDVSPTVEDEQQLRKCGCVLILDHHSSATEAQTHLVATLPYLKNYSDMSGDECGASLAYKFCDSAFISELVPLWVVHLFHKLDVFTHELPDDLWNRFNAFKGFILKQGFGRCTVDLVEEFLADPDAALEQGQKLYTSQAEHTKKVFAQRRLGEFETRTDGYSILGINGSYTIRTAVFSHKFILQINNVFDQVYYNHLSRIKTVMPEDGRSLNIQYRVVF